LLWNGGGGFAQAIPTRIGLKTMKLASIQSITNIREIPGADRIEAATVLGYQTVIKKGEFCSSDLCVWHEPDTIVPERPEYEFLRKQGFRLKVSRFKGQVSQGLALPLSILPPGDFSIGDDLTDVIGIRKYEKPVPANLAGAVKGAFPSWIAKTDEPNLRSFPEALAEFAGLRCVITQKLDGTSGTFYLRDGNFGVCSRNLELLEDTSNSFWQVAREFRVHEALASLGGDFALQGEVHGAGIQGNHMKLSRASLRVFNLFDIANHQYLDHSRLADLCRATGLPMVQVVWEGDFCFTLEELIRLANEQEYAPGAPAEGIVIRPIYETRSLILPGGRLSAKIVSERYALKHGE
jgi:RNA ligase (TIGR02306 family)